MSSVNALIDAALKKAGEDEPLLFNSEIRATLEAALITAATALIPDRLTLASNKPDFESIILRLVQELQADPVWKDLVTSGTGMTLLRNIAAGITYILYANERALQEAYPGSATSENSIFMATRGLGVNPQRRIPARVNVTITRLDNSALETVAQFSEFTIRGVKFFNREAIVFNETAYAVDVILYQGEILTLEAVADGTPLDRIEIGTESGYISQEDVYVLVDGVQWGNSLVGLYNADRYEKVVYTSTLPNKNVEIQFGDNRYGAMPAADANIKIVWAETEGEAQNFNQSDLTVTLIDSGNNTFMSGITTSQIYGGSEALSAQFYKTQASHLHSLTKQNGAVTRQQWRSLALKYPGVVDAIFRFQAELAPEKRSYMNLAVATILTKDGVPFDDIQWAAFVSYLHDNSIYRMEIGRSDPMVREVDISAKVYCQPRSDLNWLKNKLEEDLRETYKPRLHALGYSLFHSDISDILEGKDAYDGLVEYVTDITPEDSVVLSSPFEYVKVNNVNLQMFYTTRNGYGGRREPW